VILNDEKLLMARIFETKFCPRTDVIVVKTECQPMRARVYWVMRGHFVQILNVDWIHDKQ